MLENHKDVPIDRESPDYGLFAIVGEAAKNDREFVDELIKLTVIRDVPGRTTEKCNPVSFSPSGRELIRIGSGLKDVIQEHFQSGRLSEWQSWVLSDVLRTYQLIELGSDGVTIPAIVLDSQGRLWPVFSPATSTNQSTLDQNQIDAATNTDPVNAKFSRRERPSVKGQFSVALTLLFVALIWGLLKRYGRIVRK
jgi:hypothetical protein